MNVGAIFRAVETALALRNVVRTIRTSTPPPDGEASSPRAVAPSPSQGAGGPVEARLTGVVIAALKEAFDRDHARLELERAQMEDQRQRADEALRLEVRRQAADRESGRLRLLAGAALIGWIVSIVPAALRLGDGSLPFRIVLAVGWVLLLGSLAAALTAHARLNASMQDTAGAIDTGRSGTAALWLLMAGLAAATMSLIV
jgi:hypothetical protein